MPRELEDVPAQVIGDVVSYRRCGDEELGGGEHVVRGYDPIVQRRRASTGLGHDELRIPPSLGGHERDDRGMRLLAVAGPAPQRRALECIGEAGRRVDVARAVVAVGGGGSGEQRAEPVAPRLVGRPDTVRDGRDREW